MINISSGLFFLCLYWFFTGVVYLNWFWTMLDIIDILIYLTHSFDWLTVCVTKYRQIDRYIHAQVREKAGLWSLITWGGKKNFTSTTSIFHCREKTFSRLLEWQTIFPTMCFQISCTFSPRVWNSMGDHVQSQLELRNPLNSTFTTHIDTHAMYNVKLVRKSVYHVLQRPYNLSVICHDQLINTEVRSLPV